MWLIIKKRSFNPKFHSVAKWIFQNLNMENVSENFNSAQKTGNQKMFLLVFAPDSVCVCKSQKSSDKKNTWWLVYFTACNFFMVEARPADKEVLYIE